jgi:serine/threonine protein kinase
MGEVYKARDTRLDRSVAIKVVSSAIADDPRWRDRLDREAHAISGLNHPHICTLHDVGHQNGVDFLVMEYLDGRNPGRPVAEPRALPIAQVLTIGIAIADALNTAHRADIVHRDLKPANIMLTKSGAKLLDFGLPTTAAAHPITMSGMTRMAGRRDRRGHHSRTIHYMAPEQVEGRDADVRSDIWALGVVLYEMAAGRRPSR